MKKTKKSKEKPKKTSVIEPDIDTSTSVGKLILGLAEEIQASEKNASKIVLKDGEFSSKVGDLYIYDFPLLDEFPFQQDTNLAIDIGKKTGIRGYLHSITRNTISIASEENVGSVLDQIIITSSDSALLKRLKDIFLDLSKNPDAIPFSTKHASFVLGEENPIAAPLASIPNDVKICTQKKGWVLNVEQESAVRTGMGSEFLLLWGPPGTGKTTTIAPMLAALAKSGESVLLVSNTNKAVDGALKMIINNLDTLGIKQSGACLRIGKSTPDFLENFGSRSDLRTVAAERNKELVHEQTELTERRAPLVSRLSVARASIQEYEAYDASIRDLSTSSKEAANVQAEIAPIEHDIAKLVGDVSRLEAEIVKAPETARLFGRLGFTRTKSEVSAELQSIHALHATQRTALAGKKNILAVSQEKIREIKNSIPVLKAVLLKLPPKVELETQANSLDEEISTIDDRLAEIEKQIANTEQVLIDEAKIIGTTVYKSFLDPRLLTKQWDVVLVDEVSMLLLPMTYFVAGKATKRVILVGDFLQLPAIISSDQENKHVAEWVKADPFRKWHVTDPKVRQDNPPSVFVGLREQNRMHDQICQLISQSFYKRWLITGARAKGRTFDGPSIGKTSKRVLWIDTSELDVWSSKRYGKGSLFNITHAALVGEIVDTLAAKGYFQGKNADNKDNTLGVVTPYAAQQELISTLLEPVKHYVPVDYVGTAHKFQGDEKDTIIVDMVEASSKPSRFINAESYDDDAGRLLNVGLSRAKEFLIVIVNKQAFDLGGSRFMQQLWGRVESASEKIDPRTLLIDSKHIQAARELAMGKQVDVEGKHVLFTEQDFYPAITTDLAKAQRSIVIFSAFMTVSGATRWFAVLGKAMSHGASVQIVTKTLGKQPNAGGTKGESIRKELANLLQVMRRSGMSADLRSETHEKIIVIDDQIVWNGSLNMLSHVQNVTREHMTRTDDENYGKEILSLLSRHDIKNSKAAGSEHPVCPECGNRTYLETGFQGKAALRCEDGCGWFLYQDSFKKLSQGIPLGKVIKPCPENKCKGSLKLRHSYGRYYLGCSCYGEGCNHKEDVHVSKYQYEPFPQGEKPDLDVLSGFKEQIWERPVEKDRPQSAKAKQPKEEPVQEEKPVAPRQEPTHKSQDKPSGKTTRSKEFSVTKPVDKEPKTQENSRSSKRAKSKKSDLDFINGLAAMLKL